MLITFNIHCLELDKLCTIFVQAIIKHLSLMKQFAEETLIMVLTAVAFVAFIAMACYIHDTFEYIPQ